MASPPPEPPLAPPDADAWRGVKVLAPQNDAIATGLGFGQSVAIDGTLAAIGAHREGLLVAESGAVLLYSLGTGRVMRILRQDVPTGSAYLGRAVDLQGDIVLAGAPGAYSATGSVKTGCAYLFRASTGARMFTLHASDGALNDDFGLSVALHGEYAVVGARAHDVAVSGGTRNDAGAVYIFSISSGLELRKVTSSYPEAGAFFGQSVALDGTLLLIGAAREDSPGFIDSGAAYLFDADSGIQIAKLTSPDAVTSGRFGETGALHHGVAIIGAPQEGTEARHTFGITSSAVTPMLKYAGTFPGGKFGDAVSLSSTHALIGAPHTTSANGAQAGMAFVFPLTNTTPTANYGV